MPKKITQSQLKLAIHYDPVTGQFTWLRRDGVPANINSRIAGKPAGTTNDDGYLVITIDGHHYYAHRLAFLYMTGRFPPKTCDHHDLDQSNNKWENLRQATKGQNQANRGPNLNSATGVKGVHPYRNKFRAKFRGRTLGYGETPQSIAHLYQEAEQKFFGEFSRPVGAP